MVIMRMKASPNGVIAMALAGFTYPSTTAITMAMRTCAQRDE
jgi:hypothetical protein